MSALPDPLRHALAQRLSVTRLPVGQAESLANHAGQTQQVEAPALQPALACLGTRGSGGQRYCCNRNAGT